MRSVRMGELAVSCTAGDELVAVGLGSCIGLAMADRESGTAGLAHILLPDSLGKTEPAGKFANLAVPHMIETMLAAGAAQRRLEAILVGGARMFAVGSGSLDIGARNAEAVRAALSQARIRIVGEETGGNRGRTASVVVGNQITMREPGGTDKVLMTLVGPRAAARVQRPQPQLKTGVRLNGATP